MNNSTFHKKLKLVHDIHEMSYNITDSVVEQYRNTSVRLNSAHEDHDFYYTRIYEDLDGNPTFYMLKSSPHIVVLKVRFFDSVLNQYTHRYLDVPVDIIIIDEE